MYFYLDSHYKYTEMNGVLESVISESEWIPVKDAVHIVRRLLSYNPYVKTDINWNMLRHYRIVDELHLPVSIERLKFEYNQAPNLIYPGYVYTGAKRKHYAAKYPKSKHYVLEKIICEDEGLRMKNPFAEGRGFRQHRPNLHRHRSWKRFRKTQWKDT